MYLKERLSPDKKVSAHPRGAVQGNADLISISSADFRVLLIRKVRCDMIMQDRVALWHIKVE